MMYQILSLVVPASFLMLTGCTPVTVSLNPLVGDKDAVSEPAIAGTWQSTDGGGHLVIRATGPTEYEVVEPKDDPEGEESFRMRLIRINGEILADMSPEKTVGLPVHWIFRVRLTGDRLRLALFNSAWLRSEITGPGGPAHAVLEDDDGDVVLTGSTAELQSFVRRYRYASKAFDSDDAEYRRVTDEKAKQD